MSNNAQSNKDLKAVLDTDFKDSEVQRDELQYYEPLAQRGSYRLKHGLFRTESEQREFIQLGRSIRLSQRKTGWRVIPDRIHHLLRFALNCIWSPAQRERKRKLTP